MFKKAIFSKNYSVLHLFGVCLLLFGACNKPHAPKMPQFVFEKADSTTFANAQLNTKKNTIFLFFHPNCDHCENEAKAMVKKITDFQKADIYWISKAEWSEIKAFDDRFGLTQNGMHVLRDAKGEGKTKFKVSDIPDVFVYDTLQEIVVEYVKEVSPDDLLKDIH